MDIKVLLGRRIQELRKARKMTQEYLSETIGIETVSLSNIERGKYYPTAENLSRIASTLQVKPQELFTFEHLASQEDLLNEMFSAMKKNENLTRLIYKFFKLVQ